MYSKYTEVAMAQMCYIKSVKLLERSLQHFLSISTAYYIPLSRTGNNNIPEKSKAIPEFLHVKFCSGN